MVKSLLLVLSLSLIPVGAFAKSNSQSKVDSKKFELSGAQKTQLAKRAALDIIVSRYQAAKNMQDIDAGFFKGLAPRDREALRKMYKNKKRADLPKILRYKDMLIASSKKYKTVRIEIVDAKQRSFKFNGVAWTFNKKMPLLWHVKMLNKKMDAQSRQALLTPWIDFLFPRAFAQDIPDGIGDSGVTAIIAAVSETGAEVLDNTQLLARIGSCEHERAYRLQEGLPGFEANHPCVGEHRQNSTAENFDIQATCKQGMVEGRITIKDNAEVKAAFGGLDVIHFSGFSYPGNSNTRIGFGMSSPPDLESEEGAPLGELSRGESPSNVISPFSLTTSDRPMSNTRDSVRTRTLAADSGKVGEFMYLLADAVRHEQGLCSQQQAACEGWWGFAGGLVCGNGPRDNKGYSTQEPKLEPAPLVEGSVIDVNR